MRETLFCRLMRDLDKANALMSVVRSLRDSKTHPALHQVEAQTFTMLPGAPFAYWVSDAMRCKFRELPALESPSIPGIKVTKGLATTDDFRFARLSFEAPPARISPNGPWVPFAKGGAFSPFYFDPHLVIDWTDHGAQLKAYLDAKIGTQGQWSRWINAISFYFRRGLTWSQRTQGGFSVRAMPAGCIFSHKGPSIFSDDDRLLGSLLALLNSTPGRAFVELQMAFGSYEVGVIQRLPVPVARLETTESLRQRGWRIYELKRSSDRGAEASHVFTIPDLLRHSGRSLSERLTAHNRGIEMARTEIVAAQREIENICCDLYAIGDSDRRAIEIELGTEVKGLPAPQAGAEATAALVSWAVGVTIGRFDVRLATGDRPIPELPDPFAPLPAYAPGMLPEGKVPAGYPVQVAEDGILVHDEGHERDVVERVREVFHLVFRENAETIEREACEILGVESLRDYLTLLGVRGFWDDHVKRYSKSRRRAPIYWLLQSPRGHYSAWVYYHRLNRDTLPKLLGPRYLGSKIQKTRHAIAELRPGGQTKPGITKQEERRLAELDELLVDLEEFGRRIRAVIDRVNDRGEVIGYDPDLDDGVVLNAAPLHELIPWPRKKKFRGRSVSELAAYWEELSQGKYDWAHVAMRYWPTRVTGKCSQDRSLALAHGLDREFFPGLREELRRQAETAATADVPDDDPATGEDDDEEEA